ncbi:hypothetical protein CA51_31200 [Rosistilla oblonga]|nr:hypothetical protein CA51_31200 [Rosistilla oblonga]
MSALVVDTDVVSLGFRQSDNFVHHYGPALVGSRLIVSFMTIAELAFGALNRQWGPRKCNQLSEYMNHHAQWRSHGSIEPGTQVPGDSTDDTNQSRNATTE